MECRGTRPRPTVDVEKEVLECPIPAIGTSDRTEKNTPLTEPVNPTVVFCVERGGATDKNDVGGCVGTRACR